MPIRPCRRDPAPTEHVYYYDNMPTCKSFAL
jgi:hypothetical protein